MKLFFIILIKNTILYSIYYIIFLFIIFRTGVKTAYFLPVRIFGDVNGCIYPKPKVEDNWIEVCGPEDENCYVPRPGRPHY